MTSRNEIDILERKRIELQAKLDDMKTQAEHNRLGQFGRPPALAEDIQSYAKTLIPEGKPVRFLDPAIGTGAFYSALLKVFSSSLIEEARGFEIDVHYFRPATRLWADTSLKFELADFTRQKPTAKCFNLVICNPPYVRHHHLENKEKTALQMRTLQACGIRISGNDGYSINLSL
ncbi:MAG: hypothetical protein L0220_03735 [Acidobacteria bacterium]|nr:hypothetical protein [Acidobacteriota bacterium]